MSAKGPPSGGLFCFPFLLYALEQKERLDMMEASRIAFEKPRVSTCLAICLLCFAVYVSWSMVLPVRLCPDEIDRLVLVQFIANNLQLPLGDEEAIRIPQWGTSYAYSVYGSSLLAQIVLIPLHFVYGDLDINTVALASRFVNILLATGTVALCFPIGSRIFGRPSTTVLFSLLVGLLPQYVFLSSYFNCDIMGIFSTALTILLLQIGLETNWSVKSCILLGISLGICSLSYYFAYGAIITSIIVYYVSTIRNRRAQSLAPVKTLISKPLIVLASALLVAGWFFVRFFIIYNGDLFGLNTASATAELYADDWLKPSNRITPKNQGMSIVDMLFTATPFRNAPWILRTAESFIGMFGYMTISLSRIEYLAYGLILAVGFAFGLVCALSNKKKRATIAWLMILIIVPLALSVFYSWSSDYQPQGRYLMSALPAWMCIVAYGWESVSELIGRDFQKTSFGSNASMQKALSLLPVLVGVIWVMLFVHVASNCIIPNCTGTLLSVY